jgi:signal transduction histidine kinase/CheY-like chemotaxis protein
VSDSPLLGSGLGSQRIRVRIGFLLATVALTVLAVAIYLWLSLQPAVVALAENSSPSFSLYRRLTDRAAMLSIGVEVARRVANDTGPASAVDLQRIRRSQARHSTPTPFSQIPPAMRQTLSRVDHDIAQLETELEEFAALATLGRRQHFPRQLQQIDSINARLNINLAEAQQRGLDDLATRSETLRGAAVRATLMVMAGAIVILLLVLVTLRTARLRISEPLARLEGGLDRVVHGDLAVNLPAERPDEIGRLVSVFNDMTQVLRDRVEEQGRFAAAGQLFAGIAHEVNNPLMAITTIAETRLGEPEVDPEHAVELRQISRQARRAAKLLAGLLRFARPSARQPGPADVGQVIDSAIDLVSYRFGVDEVDVAAHFPPDLPWGDADPSRLEQALVNLLSNAIDAVAGQAGPRLVRVEAWEVKGELCIAVDDNGPGIPSDLRDRLFHPFVSSKGPRGTGLGLYISRQILRESGGELRAEAGPLGGARFLLTLPRVAGGAIPSNALFSTTDRRGATRGATPLSRLRLLVVEDEETVRRPLCRFLERRGAIVLNAPNGAVALDLLRDHPVDLVLSDLRMPVMDGIALYQELRRRHVELTDRFLVVSGDLTRLAEGELGVPADRVLVKPVDLFQLEKKIVELAGKVAA